MEAFEAEEVPLAAAAAAAAATALPLPLVVAFSGAIPASLPRAGWVAAMRASSSAISAASASALRGFLLARPRPDGGAPGQGGGDARLMSKATLKKTKRAVAMWNGSRPGIALAFVLFDSPGISRQDERSRSERTESDREPLQRFCRWRRKGEKAKL